MEKAISQLGRKIVRWSEPHVSKVFAPDASKLPRWVFTNPDTPDGPIESLGIESLHELYREFLALVHDYKGVFVRTTEGRIQRKTWRGESSQESPDSRNVFKTRLGLPNVY